MRAFKFVMCSDASWAEKMEREMLRPLVVGQLWDGAIQRQNNKQRISRTVRLTMSASRFGGFGLPVALSQRVISVFGLYASPMVASFVAPRETCAHTGHEPRGPRSWWGREFAKQHGSAFRHAHRCRHVNQEHPKDTGLGTPKKAAAQPWTPGPAHDQSRFVRCHRNLKVSVGPGAAGVIAAAAAS